jgi:hypothetical protein
MASGKCAVVECDRPWTAGQDVTITLEWKQNPEGPAYTAEVDTYILLCDEHANPDQGAPE